MKVSISEDDTLSIEAKVFLLLSNLLKHIFISYTSSIYKSYKVEMEKAIVS